MLDSIAKQISEVTQRRTTTQDRSNSINTTSGLITYIISEQKEIRDRFSNLHTDIHRARLSLNLGSANDQDTGIGYVVSQVAVRFPRKARRVMKSCLIIKINIII